MQENYLTIFLVKLARYFISCKKFKSFIFSARLARYAHARFNARSCEKTHAKLAYFLQDDFCLVAIITAYLITSDVHAPRKKEQVAYH